MVLAVAAIFPATASAATPVLDEHAACVELRDTGKSREALQHCHAAYDALPVDISDAALHDRAMIVFNTHYAYQNAAAQELALLCDEAVFLRGYLAFLDAHVSVDTRPADRRDAQALLDALGEHRCGPSKNDLLPVRSDPVRREKPVDPDPGRQVEPVLPSPLPKPIRPARPLRVAGGVTLGAGLLFAAATAIPLAFGEALERQRDALMHAPYPMGQVPKDVLAADAQLDAAGVRLNRVAAGVGGVAGATILAGITMLAVDGRRHRRSQRFALHPRVWPHAGLHMTLEF